jgi:hypothetical protein
MNNPPTHPPTASLVATLAIEFNSEPFFLYIFFALRFLQDYERF